jgi:(p)ppGpp synthase/HD superfamily hydrolase
MVFIAVGMLNQIKMNKIKYNSLALAAEYHKYQQYGVKPYLYHLLDVWLEAEKFCNENNIKGIKEEIILSVCALHDTLEDTTLDENKIKLIHKEVFNSVKLLTKKPPLKNYYNNIGKNEIASIVKLCDRICNVRECIKNRDYRKLKKYINESKKFKIIYSDFNKPLSKKLERLYLKGKLISIFRIAL